MKLIYLILAFSITACSSGVLVQHDGCKFTGIVKDGHPIDRCPEASL